MSRFDPPRDPYAFVPAGRNRRGGDVFFDVFRLKNGSAGPEAVLNTTYRPRAGRYGEVGEYPLSL